MDQLPLPELPEDYFQRMPQYGEAETLEQEGTDTSGRPALLTPETAAAWRAMRDAAAEDGLTLVPVSTFRSLSYQEHLLRRKIDMGIPWDEILAYSAYPGFSEHHTGRAIDIGSPASQELEETFETTPEFAWLTRNAARFGFRMSYPSGNSFGIGYEPWHWAWGEAI